MERKNDTHNEEMKNLKLNQKDLCAKVAQYHTFLEVDQNIEERKKALKCKNCSYFTLSRNIEFNTSLSYSGV